MDSPVASATRERTHGWPDPGVYADPIRSLDGLSFLEQIGAGVLPQPGIMQSLGIRPVEVEAGRIVFAMRPAEYHYNPLGTVHGGVICAILDSAAGCAVHSTLPAGVGFTSLDLSTRFLRPITVEVGEVTCEGTVVSAGKRTAMAEASLRDGTGRLLAHATSGCLILRP